MENKVLAAAMVALGLTLSGLMVYLGIHEMAQKDDVVCVKGLSMRDVTADYVVWPLSFTIEGDDLSKMYGDMSRVTAKVMDFLEAKGFDKTDMSQGNTTITDNWANYYDHRPEHHYQLSSSVVISTANVDLVISGNGCQSELLGEGIILNSYAWNMDYQYNGLSELKPDMIEEATKNARAVAQKFADDSGSRLGHIRHASQGQFTVESDQNQPWIKHVRVVTTLDYALK